VGFESRLQAAASSLRAAAIDALLITPGADLRYLVGYDAKPLERLTCLVVPAEGDPIMVVPALEELAALASPLADLGLSDRDLDRDRGPHCSSGAAAEYGGRRGTG
jgi:Xaa-Pro aminopeptidase